MAISNFTKISPRQKIRETYEEDTTLFGLIKYDRLIKKETIGEELLIVMNRVPEEIFINGVRYIPSSQPLRNKKSLK